MHAETECPGLRCDPTSGAVHAVTPGQTTPNIDFTLSPAAIMSGQVLLGGQEIPSFYVDLYDATGAYAATGFS